MIMAFIQLFIHIYQLEHMHINILTLLPPSIIIVSCCLPFPKASRLWRYIVTTDFSLPKFPEVFFMSECVSSSGHSFKTSSHMDIGYIFTFIFF